ncbi:MAG: phospho-N-acetylmuramoyl-pentapeptide-transferase [Candidatus Harrisonbacteria bacterium RIFCSPLOWO2_01_FULL_40_28]|uniref:Phospho-N-acetylmuramoyl-pentapeptide-transferase n=2 Tax=Candidatus Harrisoniibacteriota TaxID=1817905 RepID=A0A1G1ZYK3_9BACT|nr:MAG: phospho-N-acetylmuramoyl-pentapeptide-transferase [Candidatus Harrisonbacteria bacterium RIFCSPLOWO2_01_FULL_40_28]OGY69632.1 MAG: phospho-N-acetylmuramoyl-pentapeptide-transferase [Candidatus Harrisonbacteria bacterium RIFOXYD1_FULL_40_9]
MFIPQAIRILGLTTVAFIAALMLTPTFLYLIERFKLSKNLRSEESAPIFFNLHKKKIGTPTMGGMIIWVTVLGLAFIFFLFSTVFDGFFSYLNFVNRAETYLPIAAMVIAAFFGLIDDLMGVFKIGPNGGGLKVSQKLWFYFGIAIVGAAWFYFKLDWDTLYIPFWGNVQIGLWYIPLFIFVIVASAFSTNETDGLDGLAGGVLLFSFTALTAVAFILERYHLAAFGGATIGALLAFLWHNIYPARFFMGDTGSMSLGITLGVIAMLTNTALLLPFFAVILVVESLSVIIQMMSKKLFGRKIFHSTPIHHHFEALGWPESQITMRFWIVSAVFSTLGLAIFFLSRFL